MLHRKCNYTIGKIEKRIQKRNKMISNPDNPIDGDRKRRLNLELGKVANAHLDRKLYVLLEIFGITSETLFEEVEFDFTWHGKPEDKRNIIFLELKDDVPFFNSAMKGLSVIGEYAYQRSTAMTRSKAMQDFAQAERFSLDNIYTWLTRKENRWRAIIGVDATKFARQGADQRLIPSCLVGCVFVDPQRVIIENQSLIETKNFYVAMETKHAVDSQGDGIDKHLIKLAEKMIRLYGRDTVDGAFTLVATGNQELMQFFATIGYTIGSKVALKLPRVPGEGFFDTADLGLEGIDLSDVDSIETETTTIFFLWVMIKELAKLGKFPVTSK